MGSNGGKCDDCSEYSRATPDNLDCKPDPCDDLSKLMKDGTCKKCDSYSRSFGPLN